ncbi:MAG: CDP-alcohol phosphatidyltransferase family protein [Chloroflexi bacterium]|nr:CDP-alcohol phosphatidyltransferase family protein [Chloroflexota bacterium]
MGEGNNLRQRASSSIVMPFVRAAIGLHLTPNWLTMIGFSISLASAAMVGLGHLLIGGIVMLVAGLFDMLDGALARKTGKATKFGALVDSVADRISEAALLSALLVLYTFRGSELGVYLSLAALIGSFMTSYVRARAEGLGLNCKVGFMTRAERVIVLGIGLMMGELFYQAPLVALSVIVAFGYLAVAQRIFHVWRRTGRGGD